MKEDPSYFENRVGSTKNWPVGQSFLSIPFSQKKRTEWKEKGEEGEKKKKKNRERGKRQRADTAENPPCPETDGT